MKEIKSKEIILKRKQNRNPSNHLNLMKQNALHVSFIPCMGLIPNVERPFVRSSINVHHAMYAIISAKSKATNIQRYAM